MDVGVFLADCLELFIEELEFCIDHEVSLLPDGVLVMHYSYWLWWVDYCWLRWVDDCWMLDQPYWLRGSISLIIVELDVSRMSLLLDYMVVVDMRNWLWIKI